MGTSVSESAGGGRGGAGRGDKASGEKVAGRQGMRCHNEREKRIERETD